MFRWLQFRFGRPPVKIHRVAFYPWRNDWYDVVIDFEKDHPEPVGVDSVQFRGWVRWLALADQPAKFTLTANRKIQFRFGVMSPIDFEAFLASTWNVVRYVEVGGGGRDPEPAESRKGP